MSVLSVVVLAVSALPAPAQKIEPVGSGHLSATTSGAALPAGAEVQVTPDESDNLYGDDPLYRAARAEARQALSARGFRVGEDSPRLRLRMVVSAVGYGQFRFPRGPTGPQSPPGPAPRGTVTDQFHVPFEVPESGVVPSLTVSLVLHDVSGGGVLWSATVRATGRFPDPERTLAQMTRLALAALGSSAERSFEVGCASPSSDRLCVD
jgi:hypothetical protein